MPKQIIASLAVDKSEITLPDNSVTLDASKSYFLNNKGEIVEKQLTYKFTGPGTIRANGGTATATNLPEGGHVFSVEVENKNETAIGTASVAVVVKPAVPIKEPMIFFGHWQDVTKEEELQINRKIGCTGFRPNGVALETYSDSSKYNFQFFFDNDIDLFVNIGWQNAVKDQIRSWPTDLNKAASQLRAFLTKWGKYIHVALCENEPTNDGYFGTQDIKIYIAWLRVFVDVCAEFGIKSCDGATHLEYFELLRNNNNIPVGDAKQQANQQQVLDLHAAYKTMPKLTYVAAHSGFKPDYVRGFVKDNIEYLATATGKPVIAHEFGFKDCTPAIVTDVVKDTIESKAIALGIWGGDGGFGNSDADRFNVGVELNSMSEAYRDAIK